MDEEGEVEEVGEFEGEGVGEVEGGVGEVEGPWLSTDGIFFFCCSLVDVEVEVEVDSLGTGEVGEVGVREGLREAVREGVREAVREGTEEGLEGVLASRLLSFVIIF